MIIVVIALIISNFVLLLKVKELVDDKEELRKRIDILVDDKKALLNRIDALLEGLHKIHKEAKSYDYIKSQVYKGLE